MSSRTGAGYLPSSGLWYSPQSSTENVEGARAKSIISREGLVRFYDVISTMQMIPSSKKKHEVHAVGVMEDIGVIISGLNPNRTAKDVTPEQSQLHTAQTNYRPAGFTATQVRTTSQKEMEKTTEKACFAYLLRWSCDVSSQSDKSEMNGTSQKRCSSG